MKATSRWLTTGAFAAAAAGALVVAFAPLGTSCRVSADGGPERCSNVDLVSVDGRHVLALVALPVVIALVPVLARVRAVALASSMLLWAFCVFGLFSVGIFFVPAAVLMTIAAFRSAPGVAASRPV